MLNTGVTFLLIIVTVVIGLVAQMRVRSAFNKYSRVRTRRGMTGAEVADAILRDAGIHDVEVARTESYLGDHYDPTNKRLCLSPGVHDSESVAAAGIAAHECGHAIQHQHDFAPLKLRMAVVPATMVTSQVLPIIMFAGFFFHIIPFKLAIDIAVIGYAIMAFFQLITLPVEFDASRRAKLILADHGVVTREEAGGVSAVLNAAAWTYVAGFLTAMAWLLHFLVLRGRD